MRGKRLILLIGVSLLVLIGSAAAQKAELTAEPTAELAELAGVQKIFETDIRLFNGQDPTAFTASAYEKVVLFGTLTPFAVEGKAAIQQLIRQYFANHDYARWTPVDPKFFVTGTSALAWGHYTLREQPRVGPRRVLHGRYTFTYTQQDEKWLLVALDFSPLS